MTTAYIVTIHDPLTKKGLLRTFDLRVDRDINDLTRRLRLMNAMGLKDLIDQLNAMPAFARDSYTVQVLINSARNWL